MRSTKISLLYLFIVLSVFTQPAVSQCTTPITIYPYTENFEASDGGWVRSSSLHWEWGQIISKPVITAAASGSKCWLVGGFNGNSYSSSKSNLQSPCFDISSLINPQVSFKVFWETERKYDGSSFEYSTDGGTVWQVLGSINSNSTCLGENWFNYDPVNFLGGPGWSGNIQSTSGSCQGSGGSGSWLTAKHTLNSILGATSVIFRFVFAAGTTCNNFDGFAIDDIRIGEAPVNGADFTYSCNANNSVSFHSSADLCSSGVLWDFDDIASGNNTSSQTDPVHVFSAPNGYTVTLTTYFVTGPPVIVSKTINVISVNAAIDSIKCNSDQDAAINLTVNPTGSYNYSWNTNPVQSTQSISNIGAGNYTVDITGTNTCSTSLMVTVVEPTALDLATSITDAKCGTSNGSISSTVTGGTGPYDYLWSTSEITATINTLSPATYSIIVTDAKGCTASANNIQVNNIDNSVNISLGSDVNICPGQTIVLSPGNFSSYKWQDNSIASTYTASATGSYSVVVTDTDGCTGSDQINVTVDCPEIYFPAAFTPNGDTFNDEFGALGSISSIKTYKLLVYGRWGEIVFSSTDPNKRWNGKYKGKTVATQAFIWTVTYTVGTLATEFRSGSVLLIH